MVKVSSCPALMHTYALVAPAAKPFAVVATHVRPTGRVDDAFLVNVRFTYALRGAHVSRAKPESRYSPRMQDPPPCA